MIILTILQYKQIEKNIIICQSDMEKILDLVGQIITNRDSLGNVDDSDFKLAKFKDYLNSENAIILKLQESVLKLTMIVGISVDIVDEVVKIDDSSIERQDEAEFINLNGNVINIINNDIFENLNF